VTAAPVTPGRAELFRALGAVAGEPADARTACAALGLPVPGNAEHTEVFVLNCPPYASVYLGADGGLGGEAADRAAGFWRAIGVPPPAEPDHLTALLSLYARLGEAAAAGPLTPATAGALARARQALFWEHLWPWLPGYLDAVDDLGTPALAPWARLARRTLTAERGRHPGGPARWSARHQDRGPAGDIVQAWWARRAARTTQVLAAGTPGSGRLGEPAPVTARHLDRRHPAARRSGP
jgi:TorA maturation chaperone TorD